jgi:hypothetical protein
MKKSSSNEYSGTYTLPDKYADVAVDIVWLYGDLQPAMFALFPNGGQETGGGKSSGGHDASTTTVIESPATAQSGERLCTALERTDASESHDRVICAYRCAEGAVGEVRVVIGGKKVSNWLTANETGIILSVVPVSKSFSGEFSAELLGKNSEVISAKTTRAV